MLLALACSTIQRSSCRNTWYWSKKSSIWSTNRCEVFLSIKKHYALIWLIVLDPADTIWN